MEECIETFSVCLLNEEGITTNLINFLAFDDSNIDINKLFIQKTLNFLKYFFPFVCKDNEITFSIFSKLDLIRKNLKDAELTKVILIYYSNIFIF